MVRCPRRLVNESAWPYHGSSMFTDTSAGFIVLSPRAPLPSDFANYIKVHVICTDDDRPPPIHFWSELDISYQSGSNVSLVCHWLLEWAPCQAIPYHTIPYHIGITFNYWCCCFKSLYAFYDALPFSLCLCYPKVH